MAFGIDRGAVGTVRELVDAARKNGARRIVFCGGDGAYFQAAFPGTEAGGEDFTLRGVAYIARHQA